MAHMIDRMMYSGEVPWHGLGIPLPEAASLEDLRNLVFDWDAIERPVYVQGEQDFDDVPRYKAIVRSDNRKVLCIMPHTYGVVQYITACTVLDAAAKDGAARFITAGTLDEGRRAWALATIPSAEFEVAGSPVKPYLLMSTAHDGSLAMRFHFTPVYVVCNNTLTAALGEAGVTVGQKARTKHLPNVIMLKHTKNVNDRLTVARALVEKARNYFGTFNETALRLVNERFTTASMKELARELFPVPDDKAGTKEEAATHAFKAQQKVINLFEGEQIAARQAPGTKWAALNAVTEYIDHHASRRGQTATALAESRFDAIINGTGAAIRQQAMDLLLAA
jgi:phage/plasmid-like protein (TIGR03299 family)